MTSTGTRSSAHEASTDVLAPVLERLRHESPAVLGIDGAAIEVVARISRPHSEIAKVRVKGRAGPQGWFVKVARLRRDGPEEFELMSDRVARDYAITKRVYQSMPNGLGLSVVRPVVCYPEHLALVTEEAPGNTLLEETERGVAWWPKSPSPTPIERVAARAGAWIDAFQQTDVARPDLSRSTVRDYIDIRLARLAENRRAEFSEDDRQAVLAVLDRDLGAVSGPGLDSVPIHGDLALGNVLVDGDRVIVLDFAMSARGSRYHDVAHLYMQVGLLGMKPNHSRRRVAQLQRQILLGFSSQDVEREPLFRLMLMQHTACHYLGLVERPAGLASRAYNSWVAHHHLAWLRRLTA